MIRCATFYMACLYRRKDSNFWWISYSNPFTGKRTIESTGYRLDDSRETRQARELEAQKTLEERTTGRSHKNEAWDVWVKPFLETHYAQSSGSLVRFLTAWRSLRMFLQENKIVYPRNLTRESCLGYFDWRRHPNYKNGKYRAGHNTALLELKTLGLIMKESVRRGYAATNPIRDLGIKRAARRLYPEMTNEALQLILDSIPKEPEPTQTFLRNSFLIARYHGVRLAETWLNPQRDVWQQPIKGELRWLIFFRQKGAKESAKLLHPELIPLMVQLREAGAVQTYERPKAADPTRWPNRASRIWFDFLKRHGVKKLVPNVCFHSLRVTAASRMARADIPKRKAMEYLTHASTTVHDAYVRWQPEDMEGCHGAL